MRQRIPLDYKFLIDSTARQLADPNGVADVKIIPSWGVPKKWEMVFRLHKHRGSCLIDIDAIVDVMLKVHPTLGTSMALRPFGPDDPIHAALSEVLTSALKKAARQLRGRVLLEILEKDDWEWPDLADKGKEQWQRLERAALSAMTVADAIRR